MNDVEYRSTQNQLLIVASLVRELDLDGFLERINKAEAIGPIVDPTLYRAAMANLSVIKSLASAANVFRKEVLAQTGPPARTARGMM